MFSKLVRDIYADRWMPFALSVHFVGVDLTGADFAMQVSATRDRASSVAALADLGKVTTAGAEGVRLVSVATVDGVTTSIIEIIIAQATMAAIDLGADAGTPGENGVGWYDLAIVPTATASFIAIQGKFIAVAGSTQGAADGGDGASAVLVVTVDTSGDSAAIEGSAAAALFAGQAKASVALVEAAAASVNAQYANVLQRAAGAAAYTNVGFINSAGVYSASAGYATTGFVAVEGGQSYTVNAAYEGGAYTLAWYDANQAFISSARAASGALQTLTVTSPSNARFARSSTTTANIAASYIQTASSRLSIDMIRDVATAHPPVIPAAKVSYGATTADAQLTANAASILALTAAIANSANEVDALTDRTNPNFVDLAKVTLSTLCNATPPEEITIVSRDSATQITLATGKGAQFIAGAGIVIFDATADYYRTYGVRSVSGDVVTVFGTLPTTCSKCMVTMDTTSAGAGQHGSLYLYRAIADNLLEQTTRTTYRKPGLLFAYHPVNCTTTNFNNPNIYIKSNTTTPVIAVTALNGAVGGGWVAGTSNSLGKACAQTTVDVNATASQPLAAYHQRFYEIADGVAGRGIEFGFSMGGFDGFIKIRLAALRVNYTGGTTDGRARLEVLADNVPVHDVSYDAGEMREIIIPWNRGQAAKLRLTLADGSPTVIRLYGVYAYKKAPVTVDQPLIRDGDCVGISGDSWSQYPISFTGLTKPTRVDGGTAEGLQIFSERLRARAAVLGRTITTRNYGKGGVTIRHGIHWLPNMLATSPEITVVVDLNTGINDNNSSANLAATNWDFHPTDRWSFLARGSGGVIGNVASPAEYVALKAKFAKMVTDTGRRCITYTPPHIASAGSAYTLTCTWGSLFAAGFEVLPA